MCFELKINPEIEALSHRMTWKRFEILKLSILKFGLKKPIECMADGTILDGQNRFKACMVLGVESKYEILEDIRTIEQAKEYTLFFS